MPMPPPPSTLSSRYLPSSTVPSASGKSEALIPSLQRGERESVEQAGGVQPVNCLRIEGRGAHAGGRGVARELRCHARQAALTRHHQERPALDRGVGLCRAHQIAYEQRALLADSEDQELGAPGIDALR